MDEDRPELLVLIRHAESERNKAKKGAVYYADEEARAAIRGIPDHLISVTEAGRIQSQKTGLQLRDMYGTPDYIYHSGFTRTIETMDGILAAYTDEEKTKIQTRMNPFIRERHPGYTYDMTKEEAERHFPWMEEYWKTFGGFFSSPVGGESLSDVCNRVYSFISMLYRDRAGKKVFVVTHGGTLRCFRFILERWTYEQALRWPEGQTPRNCGVTTYKFDGKPLLQEYNATYW